MYVCAREKEKERGRVGAKIDDISNSRSQQETGGR